MSRTSHLIERNASMWYTKDGRLSFRWNSRTCTGIDLHAAVLHEDLEAVESIILEDPSTATRRFTYETLHLGKAQEGSGEAIHLAVTRASVDVVKLLIANRAALDAMVTRDHKPHYDVLHAAVFSEGRGGLPEIIKCLLDAKAPPTKNLDGSYPLHKAFQIGGAAVQSIPLLRKDMEERGMLEAVENDLSSGAKTPLQYGIETGKMTREQLVQVAPITAVSLKVFLHDEPQCIPSFLERLQKEEVPIPPEELVQYVTIHDLCKSLRECSETVSVLLDGLCGDPVVENPGWHPLPTRLSFGPKSVRDVIRNMMNPLHTTLCTYQWEKTWSFDAVSFLAPPWHDNLHKGNREPPIRDVSVKVCYLPEIVCAEVFGDLCEADSDEVWMHPLVRSLLMHVWWGGAYKVDIIQLLITMMGLVLLMMDKGDWFSVLEDTDLRRLWRPPEGTALSVHSGLPSIEAHSLGAAAQVAVTVADEFIGARGIVDLMHELVQFVGFVKLGRARQYLTMGNALDIFRACLAIGFYKSEHNTTIVVLLILLYWFRLLEMSFSEHLMKELLPITMLARGLAPSTTVCCIAICAFTHARWAMLDRPLWPDTFYESFALLITAGIPTADDSWLLVFAYLAVSCFTVFFLNIFISVISENYAAEKEAASVSFKRKRCGLCFTFLLRGLVLPCRLMSDRMAQVMTILSGLVQVAILLAGVMGFAIKYSVVILVVAQGLMLLCCYQDDDETWTTPKPNDPRLRYMWYFDTVSSDKASDEDRIGDDLSQALVELEELKAALVKRGVVADGDGRVEAAKPAAPAA